MARNQESCAGVAFSAGKPSADERQFALVIIAAVAMNLALATLLAIQSPGLHYDEALMAHGAVHILTGEGEPTFAHDRGSWIQFGSHWFPLMVIPYVGAAKHYLLLAPFALFGPRVLIVRLVSALLAALGIWGLARLVRQEIGALPAAALAVILAVHPAYLDQTVFDSTGVSMWMGGLGLVCLALAYYLRRSACSTAFLLGVACGFGVWARLNFIWLLGSAAAAALLVLGRQVTPPRRHILSILGGSIIGAAPVLIYEILSSFETLRFMSTNALKDQFVTLLPIRFFYFTELLISDSELRGMWGGTFVPEWQRLAFGIVLFGSIIVALLIKHGKTERETRWRKGFAITLIIFVIIMMTSRMNILQHHMITALPLAAVVVVLALYLLAARSRLWIYVAAAIGAFCIPIMIYWDIAAMSGLHRTGGISYWSDAIYAVADTIVKDYPDRPVRILDWGFGNNLYILGKGRIHTQELFWGATVNGTAFGERWSDLISRGGIFLTGGDRSLHSAFAPATIGFREALAAANIQYLTKRFYDRGGAIFAELFYISGTVSPDS